MEEDLDDIIGLLNSSKPPIPFRPPLSHDVPQRGISQQPVLKYGTELKTGNVGTSLIAIGPAKPSTGQEEEESKVVK